MFVTELDRPWTDTPFLIQGFLVDSEIELSTLRKYCGHVFVDVDRSDPVLADAIRGGTAYEGPQAPSEPGARRHGAPGPVVLPRLNTRWPRPDRSPLQDSDTEPVPAQSDDAHAAGPDDAPHAPRAGTASPTDRDDAANTARPASDAYAPSPDDVRASPGATPHRTGHAGAPPRAHRMRADVRISEDTRERFRRFVRTMADAANPDDTSLASRALTRLGHLFGSHGAQSRAHRADAQAAAAIAAELRIALPPDAKLRAYAEQTSVEEEIAHADDALDRAEKAMTAAIRDVLDANAPRARPLVDAVERMVRSTIRNPDAIAWAARAREDLPVTRSQGVRTGLCMISLGRQLGLPQAQMIHFGMIGMLADIGKSRLPRALLEKPGMLSPAEYSIVKEHVRLGLELLAQDMSFAPEVALGIAQHHERLDGSGYPKGLRGDEISLYGRAAGIADSFSALVAARPYASPQAPQNALMNLYQWAGTSFHAPLVEQFVQAIGVFPVGSLVELSDGTVAVVKARDRPSRLQPRVRVLTDAQRRPLAESHERALADRETHDAKGRALRVVRGLPAGAFGLQPFAHERDPGPEAVHAS